MPVRAFDHVNILTANLAEMTRWYERVLGLAKGWRPPFGDNGAWLYLGSKALVHLVDVSGKAPLGAGRIEHFALRAEGLDDFRAHLAENGIAADEIEVPGAGILQLNIHDPDGNHIHIDFMTG